MNEEKKTKLAIIICLILIIVLAIILLVFYSKIEKQREELYLLEENDVTIADKNIDDPDSLEMDADGEIDLVSKIYSDQKYVFSKEMQEIYYDDDYGLNQLSLLVINIDSEEIGKINEENEEFYNKYKPYYSDEDSQDEIKELPTLFYSYWIYNDILSVRISYRYNNVVEIKCYNIDIKNKEILTNEEFLDKLEIDKEKFESLVDESLHESYLQEESVGFYSDFNKYINDIKFEKDNTTFENDFDKICDLCNITLWENGQIRINNLVIPTYWHPSINDGIVLN